MSDPDPNVIDADFVEEPKRAEPPPGGFGRRVVASDSRPAKVLEGIADAMDEAPVAARVVSNVARRLGKTEVAEKVEAAGEVTQKAAEVVRALPSAYEGIKREGKPLIDKFKRLMDTMKEKKVYVRREPRTVAHAPKRRHGKPMPGQDPHVEGDDDPSAEVKLT